MLLMLRLNSLNLNQWLWEDKEDTTHQTTLSQAWDNRTCMVSHNNLDLHKDSNHTECHLQLNNHSECHQPSSQWSMVRDSQLLTQLWDLHKDNLLNE